MLKSVHLVGEGEGEDLYADFDDYNPAYDAEVRIELFLNLISQYIDFIMFS